MLLSYTQRLNKTKARIAETLTIRASETICHRSVKNPAPLVSTQKPVKHCFFNISKNHVYNQLRLQLYLFKYFVDNLLQNEREQSFVWSDQTYRTRGENNSSFDQTRPNALEARTIVRLIRPDLPHSRREQSFVWSDQTYRTRGKNNASSAVGLVWWNERLFSPRVR
jgi:hypothetical protein